MTEIKNILTIKNNQSIDLDQLELLSYSNFFQLASNTLILEENHCVNYFAFKTGKDLQFIMLIANDTSHIINR